jgi:hypothetical protein
MVLVMQVTLSALNTAVLSMHIALHTARCVVCQPGAVTSTAVCLLLLLPLQLQLRCCTDDAA